MKTTGNTVLITGGSAGIGFEIAKLFSENNKVIITGRNEGRLDKALSKLKNTQGFVCDVTDYDQVEVLKKQLKETSNEINILINNAGYAAAYKLNDHSKVLENAKQEMETNFFATINFIDAFLPFVKINKNAAIVNVNSIAAYHPISVLPTYSASKSALHIYTDLLRDALVESKIKVFEVIPPLVNTEFSKSVGGEEHGIPPQEVALELLNAMTEDRWVVPVGMAKQVVKLS